MTDDPNERDHFFDEFLGEVPLDHEGNITADVYQGLDVTPVFTIELDEVIELLENIGGVQGSQSDDTQLNIIPAPPDFDPSDPDFRPFSDLDAILQFLEDTGLEDVTIFQTDDGEFFLSINSE